MNLLTWLRNWLDTSMDMHLDFTGDLMTPDWTLGDGDPVLRPERKPATLTPIAAHVERLKDGRRNDLRNTPR